VEDSACASAHELKNSLGNEIARLLKREVTGIEQMQLRLWDVSLVSCCTSHGEEGIVLTPDDQRLWLPAPKELMPFVVEAEIRLIVVK
jgi:hypothetical protein